MMTNALSRWIDELPADRLIAEFSVWSANLTRLAEEMGRIEPFADILHVDVADGHFSPALLFFPDLVVGLRRTSSKPIHVHLMVSDFILLSQIEQFAEAGADLISIHLENGDTAGPALDLIESRGISAGMVLKVDTPIKGLRPFLHRLRFVTLLGTAIGVKGQGLSEAACDRLGEAATLIASTNLPHRIVLAADGGIRANTVPLLRRAGAETVVLGSLAFGESDLASRMAWLRSLGSEGYE